MSPTRKPDKMDDSQRSSFALTPILEVRTTLGAGRGLFITTDAPEGALVLETTPFAVAISREFAARTCPVCLDYTGHHGRRQRVEGGFCSEPCASFGAKVPGFAAQLLWTAAFREEILARKQRLSKKKAQNCSECLSPLLDLRAHISWDAEHVACDAHFVPCQVDLDSCQLCIIALSRWWAEQQLQSESLQHLTIEQDCCSTVTHLESTEHLCCEPANTDGLHNMAQGACHPSLADLLSMQDNEHYATAHLPAARLAVLKACYRLLRRLSRRLPSLPAILGPDSSRFRAVLFREMGNSFGLWEPGPDDPAAPGFDERDLLGVAIYPQATFFNHSCLPNVYRAALPGKWGAARFLTTRRVSAGEELTIAYCSVRDSASDRQLFLREHYFFACRCVRCVDEPTTNAVTTSTSIT